MSENEDIQPGSFRPVPENQPLYPEVQAAKEIKAESRPDLVAKYQLFDRTVKPSRNVVYHPCGANDVSPSFAFSGSRVVYVELDEQAIKALQKEGFEAHHASALEFDPGDVDVLIMLNPQIAPDIPASHIREGGYALVNDYHATATTLRRNSDFRLKALIRVAKDQGLIYDTDKPEDYWTEIDSEEEFRNAPFDWGAANYTMALPVVEAITGKRENVLTEYKKIIEMAREQQRQQNAKMLAEHPDWTDVLGDSDQEDVLMFNHEGRQHVLPTSLPRKKGTVDDLFVFERIQKPKLDQGNILK